jgi:hypothetical protein
MCAVGSLGACSTSAFHRRLSDRSDRAASLPGDDRLNVGLRLRHADLDLPGRLPGGPSRVHRSGALDLTIPLGLAALVFAISTDYGVFLLMRVREARLAGRPDREAISSTVAMTARIITLAALLFAVSIGVSGISGIIVLKILGVATAFAVLVDALLVRSLLFPASLALLGRRGWSVPTALMRLHGRIGLHED